MYPTSRRGVLTLSDDGETPVSWPQPHPTPPEGLRLAHSRTHRAFPLCPVITGAPHLHRSFHRGTLTGQRRSDRPPPRLPHPPPGDPHPDRVGGEVPGPQRHARQRGRDARGARDSGHSNPAGRRLRTGAGAHSGRLRQPASGRCLQPAPADGPARAIRAKRPLHPIAAERGLRTASRPPPAPGGSAPGRGPVGAARAHAPGHGIGILCGHLRGTPGPPGASLIELSGFGSLPHLTPHAQVLPHHLLGHHRARARQHPGPG